MRLLFRALVQGALIPAIAATLTAQSPAPTATLEGSVRDSATGAPLQKAIVCVSIPVGPTQATARCANSDSAGAYRVDSVSAPGRRVFLYCDTVIGLGGKPLRSDSIVFEPGARVRRDWLVPSAGCDTRPIRHLSGTFRGHYSAGFEQSEFIPCPAEAWFTLGDSLHLYRFDNRRAWVEWSPSAADGVRWPRVKAGKDGYPHYYVRCRGSIVGPGRYGHMGVSAFQFRVDSVLELRAPTERDCR
jgi:hypothetical protein